MVSLGESISNFVGYIAIAESWGGDSEYGVSVYVKPNSSMLNFLLDNLDRSYSLKISALNKMSEATAFSVRRSTGQLMQFKLEGEIIIPIYSLELEHEKH